MLTADEPLGGGNGGETATNPALNSANLAADCLATLGEQRAPAWPTPRILMAYRHRKTPTDATPTPTDGVPRRRRSDQEQPLQPVEGSGAVPTARASTIDVACRCGCEQRPQAEEHAACRDHDPQARAPLHADDSAGGAAAPMGVPAECPVLALPYAGLAAHPVHGDVPVYGRADRAYLTPSIGNGDLGLSLAYLHVEVVDLKRMRWQRPLRMPLDSLDQMRVPELAARALLHFLAQTQPQREHGVVRSSEPVPGQAKGQAKGPSPVSAAEHTRPRAAGAKRLVAATAAGLEPLGTSGNMTAPRPWAPSPSRAPILPGDGQGD